MGKQKKLLFKTGELNFWSNELLVDLKGFTYAMVDGQPHYITDHGEPISPVHNYELLDRLPRFNVISPDGFAIHQEDNYPSEEAAKEAFSAWKKQFESQGYYSAINGRIDLDQLWEHCTVIRE